MKKLLLTIGGLLVVVWLLQLAGLRPPGPREPESAAAAQPDKPALELLEAEGTVTDSGGYIEGRIRNNQETAIRRAIVVFALYNDAGAEVGKARTTTDGLEPGATWEFKAASLMKGWTKFKVDELTGM